MNELKKLDSYLTFERNHLDAAVEKLTWSQPVHHFPFLDNPKLTLASGWKECKHHFKNCSVALKPLTAFHTLLEPHTFINVI